MITNVEKSRSGYYVTHEGKDYDLAEYQGPYDGKIACDICGLVADDKTDYELGEGITFYCDDLPTLCVCGACIAKDYAAGGRKSKAE
jgi:hypothetical protein